MFKEELKKYVETSGLVNMKEAGAEILKHFGVEE